MRSLPVDEALVERGMRVVRRLLAESAHVPDYAALDADEEGVTFGRLDEQGRGT